MLSTRQPDGSYATTPILAGVAVQPDCQHVWDVIGPNETVDLGELTVQMELQRCTRCFSAYRTVYRSEDQAGLDQRMESYKA